MPSCSLCRRPLTGGTNEVTIAPGVVQHRACLQQLLAQQADDDEAPDRASGPAHANRCQYGGECRQLDDRNHCQDYRHPDYCYEGGRCQNQSPEHLKSFRHLPLCPKFNKCIDYQKGLAEHCNRYRHFAPNCPYGNNCVDFHNKKHLDEYHHSYPAPCFNTPFHCRIHSQLTENNYGRHLPDAVHHHCLGCSHICRAGRNCTETTELHWSRSVHIARNLCPHGERCVLLADEEHLNSFTHPKVLDIRPLCSKGEDCPDRNAPNHTTKFRHNLAQETGVAPYYNLDRGIDFARNHRESFERVKKFAAKQNWKPMPSGTVPSEILNWIRTVQPIHRCHPVIFESILLHGHVMSREYMENLKDPRCVATSVLQHSRLRRIDALKTRAWEDDARDYITAMVCVEYLKHNFTSGMSHGEDLLKIDTGSAPSSFKDRKAYYQDVIARKGARLAVNIPPNDMEAIDIKTMDIAQASIKLFANPGGIGHAPDKILGTNQFVFSVLGPHQGHYYGDVFVIFKREILHHPDANLSMQAATTYLSGNAYNFRPWLGSAPGTQDERVKHYHATKFHAAIPGYEYAISAELMALTGLHFKTNSLDVSLQQIFDRWTAIDSHQAIEAHLPQLIPLEYIEHVYIPKNLFENLSEHALRAVSAVFKDRFSVADQVVEPAETGPILIPRPRAKIRAEYQDSAVHTLLLRYKKYTAQLALNYHRGFTWTIPASKLQDHYVLPLTIPQTFEHYRTVTSEPSTENITYIYWKALNGDMMVTLSNEEINPMDTQPQLRCLVCYVAAKPVVSDDEYHEGSTYLTSGHPFKHETNLAKGEFKIKSNNFYLGCNLDDFFTYCLEIHRGTGHAILSHAGPNGIYNHNALVCRFSQSELDLTKLRFIHVSAGRRRVPMRNLIVCFERQPQLHPTFDRNFKSNPTIITSSSSIQRAPERSTHENENASSTRCRDGIYCLIRDSEDGSQHNATYSHPCRYSELCDDMELHLTHDRHRAPKCDYDRNCNKLDDPFHRAACRHTHMPDFLIPCHRQGKCTDTSSKHRKIYFHGERVLDAAPPAAATTRDRPAPFTPRHN